MWSVDMKLLRKKFMRKYFYNNNHKNKFYSDKLLQNKINCKERKKFRILEVPID